jgi:hypothetical protein
MQDGKVLRQTAEGLWCTTIILPEQRKKPTSKKKDKLALLSRSRLGHYRVGGAWWHPWFYDSF